MLSLCYQCSKRLAPKRTNPPSLKPYTSRFAALIATLDDFQKAQGFFVAAVQVTTLVALSNLSLVAAGSAARLKYNINFMSISAVSGMSSTYLVYTILRWAKAGSLFIGLFTTIAGSFCTVTIGKVLLRSPQITPILSNSGTAPEVCGGVLPTTLCAASPQPVLDIPLLAWIVIFISGSFAGLAIFFDWATPHRTKQWTGFWVLAAQSYSVALLVYSLYCYLSILKTTPGTLVDRNEWDLSQLVTVTVWIPVIAECVNYNMRM